MDRFVREKFGEWTKGVSTQEALVKIFLKIRDIPYFVDPALFDLEKGPGHMLERDRGSCTPKHYLLGAMFTALGVPVKYCTYCFKWIDQEAQYSPAVKEQAWSLPAVFHLACKAFIGGKWVIVDATWDIGLKTLGFPVNSDWDGISDTVLAVKAIEEYSHDDPVERDRFAKEKMAAYSLSEKLELSRFSGALNNWLAEGRSEALPT